MLKPKLEGQLSPFFTAGEVMSAGTIVKLGANGTVVKANAGDKPYGIVAQEVLAGQDTGYPLTSVTANAYVGEKVGVYFGGGIYETDQIAVNVNAGDELYVGANGKFTKTAPSSGYTQPVAIAETSGNAGELVRIRLYI